MRYVLVFALVVLTGCAGCTHTHEAAGRGGGDHPAEPFHCADCRLSRERCRCACFGGAPAPDDCDARTVRSL